MALSRFVKYSCQVPAWREMGNDGSLANNTVSPIYVSGVMYYWVFEPGDAALATAGLSRASYLPLMCMQAQGGGEYTTASPDTTGKQLTTNQFLASKLGFGSAADGSLAVPDTTCPFLVIFPQITVDWVTLAGNQHAAATSGVRKHRAFIQGMEACLFDVMKRYPIDTRRMGVTGTSSGGSAALGYLYGRAMGWPGFNFDFASCLLSSSWIGLTNRADWPDGNTAENYFYQTVPRVSRMLAKSTASIWLFNSTGDATITPGDRFTALGYTTSHDGPRNFFPASYTATITASGQARNEKWSGDRFRTTEYINPTAPDHLPEMNTMYGGNVLNGAFDPTHEIWQWMRRQRVPMAANPYRVRGAA